jgi:LmbE family N-acetylglucosaminyl deacetylase
VARRVGGGRRPIVPLVAAVAVLVSGVVGGLAAAPPASAGSAPTSLVPSGCAAGTTLNVVAHQDDELLFQSSSLTADLRAGRCVTTVFVTAGDAGHADAYWHERELGPRAAYAEILGVADAWTAGSAVVDGRTVAVARLDADPRVQLVSLRLPDGGMDGEGFPRTGDLGLPALYAGTIPSLTAVDGSATYTRASLQSLLLGLMTTIQPTNVNTLDHVGDLHDGDHPDHHIVGYLTDAAQRLYSTPHGFAGHQGYGIADRPSNLTLPQVLAKADTFFRYAEHDPATCGDWDACWNRGERQWFSREYTVGTPTTTPPAPPVAVDPNAPLSTHDVTPGAVVTASSQNTADGQTAVKAVDGVADGYPGDHRAEWATTGGRDGSRLSLVWPSARTIDQVVLHDRPNTSDRITGATLAFSDGSTVAVPALPDDGTAATVTFPARASSSVVLTVTSVSASTRNVGLSEITVRSATAPPVVTQPVLTDVTAGAVATASWDDAAAGQTAAKAIDGVADGYPGAAANEWVAPWGRTGVALTLTWSAPVTMDTIVLHDRPNPSDRITGGTLTFSDGSVVEVPALDDSGGATTVTFPARSSTSVVLTTTSVSATTRNVGLAELRVKTTS